MKQIIALDVCVGMRRRKALEDLGYKVVVVAKPSETDDSWLNRAFVAGARFAISADLDIPRLIETHHYPMAWINYPSNEKGMSEYLVKYIDDSIKAKLRFYEMFHVKPKPTPVPVKKSLIKTFLEKCF